MTITECLFCHRPMETIHSKSKAVSKYVIRHCAPCKRAFLYDQKNNLIDVYKDVEED